MWYVCGMARCDGVCGVVRWPCVWCGEVWYMCVRYGVVYLCGVVCV